MKKLNYLTLLFAALLVSGSAWGAGTNNVRLTYQGFQQDYTSLQEAFNNLPENSTPATVTLLGNVYVDYEVSVVSVPHFNNVTLDLNGDTIFGYTEEKENSVVITNYGTLTITDNTADKEGCITNTNSNPEYWKQQGKEYPSYTHNTITNYGTMYVVGGTISNYSGASGACYAIENSSLHGQVRLYISGGKVYNLQNHAIRQICFSTIAENLIEISGGVVEGTRAVWIQLPGSNHLESPLGSLKIKGGIVKSNDVAWSGFTEANGYYAAVYSYSHGALLDKIKITISGGEIYGTILCAGGYKEKSEQVSITGGEFLQDDALISTGCVNSKCIWTGGYASYAHGQCPWVNDGGWKQYDAADAPKCISGGIFKGRNGIPADELGQYDDTYAWSHYVMDGYCIYPYGDAADDLWEIRPCGSETATGSGNWGDVNTWQNDSAGQSAKVPDAATIVTVNNNSVITVTSGTNAEANQIKANGEGQIIVKDGATLNVGSGGVKSENDELISIIVEAGGKLTVGNGGIIQNGDTIPVEVMSDGSKSGVLMVSPTAPNSSAQAPAQVRVFTRAYKNGDIEHWQHMACPVRNLKSLKPLSEVRTQMFQWSYDTDKWEYVPGTPTAKGIIEPEGWKGTNLLEPFRAYDLINTSLPSAGGVIYEFEGDLVGNQDMILNFPEHGYCIFGNSYTAPIDLNTLFGKVINDMPEENVDPCVYIFNSLADRYESVNALDLYLKEVFEIEPAFTQIPPQQAFVMNLRKGNSAQTSVDYAESVWGNQNTSLVDPIRIPKRMEYRSIAAILDIRVSDGESTDKVVLVEGSDYDDTYNAGADAEKYMNGTFNIYANTSVGKLGMVAADKIDGTMLSLNTGKQIAYTMTFKNVVGEYILIDHANDAEVAIVKGDTYSFVANANSTVTDRFEIVKSHTMPTDIENVKGNMSKTGVYTILGHYVGEVDNWNVLPAGMYVIDGIKLVK